MNAWIVEYMFNLGVYNADSNSIRVRLFIVPVQVYKEICLNFLVNLYWVNKQSDSDGGSGVSSVKWTDQCVFVVVAVGERQNEKSANMP